MDKSELLKEVLKYVDVRGLVVTLLLNQVVKPAVQKLVAESDNKYDDMLVAVLLPQVEKNLVELLDKLLGKPESK